MNSLNSHEGHKFWLKITALVVGGFVGPILFLGTMPDTSEMARWTLDLLSYPLDGKQTYNDPTTRFLSAICGGVVLGWAAMIWSLSVWVYDKAPKFTRKSTLTGLIVWFIFDSTGSITSGNASNAIVNVGLLLTAAGPLWVPAKKEK